MNGKNKRMGVQMVNVMAEAVAARRTSHYALRHLRCPVLADGFYEWQRIGGAERPMRIAMRSGDPFAFAVLWSVWKDPGGNRVPSCTTIIAASTDLLRPIHDRMPVILPREMEKFWLDKSAEAPSVL